MREPYQKISHGVIPTLERLEKAEATVRDLNGEVDLPFSFAITSSTSRFEYLFPALQTADARLPEVPETYARLVGLGDTMREPDGQQPDSSVPSAYTYFGQFVDHDITFEAKSDNIVKLSDPDFRVLTRDEIRTKIANGRTPGLDLDNIYYKPAPRNCSRMVVGFVSSVDPNAGPRQSERPATKTTCRNDRSNDRAALIGDKRDDENLIAAQLHVAFLRAHNAIVARNHTFG
jgi:hypothetical protein